MNGLKNIEQRGLGCIGSLKNNIRIFCRADVTVKIDRVTADDHEGHSATRQQAQDFNRVRRRH